MISVDQALMMFNLLTSCGGESAIVDETPEHNIITRLLIPKSKNILKKKSNFFETW